MNYHYIREAMPERGIYGVTPNSFETQLDLIANNGFHFISLEEMHAAILSGEARFLKKKSCLVTFDDGLRESYEVGLPLLDRKGIPAAFYVSSSTIQRALVLDVHKFHFIQSQMSTQQIMNFIPSQYLSRLDSVLEDVVNRQYFWDDSETSRVKYLINFLLTPTEKKEVIQELFNKNVLSEVAFAKDLYMSYDQVSDLAKRKYLGFHGVSHLPLATLSLDQLNFEIKGSSLNLPLGLSEKVDSISYPYGGRSAVGQNVFDAARNANYISGLTMLPGLNNEKDLIHSPLQLKRFDTNDVFGGKTEYIYRSLFND
ncbi:polysaccharide deacetylase family protein [Polynucleobacter paneuropaeus]|nr:polysaccharide deacetylase family protein [Polynucleobacter paneuropaeus]